MKKNPIKRLFKAIITKLHGGVAPHKASPDELLGELFQDVQLRQVYPDGMTFVDLVPMDKLRKILEAYEKQRQQPGFDLHVFVQQYFKEYLDHPVIDYKTNPNHTIEQHINELWDVLTRETYRDKGSLLAMPYPYVVPGGRFGAQWYWDSYFTMLGLAASGRYDLIEGMVKNFAYLIRKFGFIPTGNRTYYTSRSQPPFFVHMVLLLAEKKGRRSTIIQYLPYLLAEYRFWTRRASELSQNEPIYRRSVLMQDGSLMARYFDNKRTPRPESYKEDVDTALKAQNRVPSKVYVDIRAAAESGWDFSSRWFKDGDISSIQTTDIIPIDLNCLLVEMAELIAEAYEALKQAPLARRWRRRAGRRVAAIQTHCWNDKKGFYFDYDFVAEKQKEDYTLAAMFPLYSKIATQEQANIVAGVIKEKFLKKGGLITTLKTTGEQWDSPNGWAPLHWVTVVGLRNYGYHELAEEIKSRWMKTNELVYEKEKKLVEKYDVINPGSVAGGGEYPLQDGFGWTNGVLMAFIKDKDHKM